MTDVSDASDVPGTPQVAHGLDEVVPAPSVVTIGNFDGVHRGHRVLLGRTVGHASDRGIRSVAITFEPHPAAVLRPGTEPPRLQTLAARVACMVDAGVDLVLVLPFTRELAALTPEEFVEQVLVDRLRTQRIVVGTTFRFGAKAAGDVVTLVEQGEANGFTTEAATLLELDDRPISSSEIRSHLDDGDVDWAARALGRPFELTGTVVAGDGRGRTIGVPTANLEVPAGLVVPGNGVYAGHAVEGDRRWPAVTNVGVRPTFEGTTRSVEVHLLDVDEDLYGREVGFRFLHRIRGEQRFDGPEQLVARIRQDIEATRRHLASAG
jgi:riboflavin kinase / FMN adenylyltransferase